MKRYFITALSALALVACQDNAAPELPVAGLIQIDPIITKATEVNFEEGDQIGLTIVKGTETYAENALMTFAGNVFTGTTMWYTEELDESLFTAYYPYSAEGVPSEFAPALDQTAGLTSSDFMAAVKPGVLPSYNAVDMVFKHLMTKIVVNVQNQSGVAVSAVEIGGLASTAALDLANQQAVATESVESNVVVKAYEVTAGTTYHAIVAPQTAALSISLKVGENIATRNLVEMTLRSGGQYTVNVEIVEGDVNISASGEIENWTDEGEIEIDESEDDEVVPSEEYIEYGGVRYRTVTLADGNVWMAENLRYVPEGKTVSSDPAEDAGVWYPAANADKVGDSALAETLGLLYDAATAFGVEEITAENAATFEGCQGICPEGWHIPTVSEMTGLVGHCSNSALVNADGAYYEAAIKGASLAALSEAGWAWQFASARQKGDVTKTGSYLVTNHNDIYGVMSYIMGSTWYQTKTNDDSTIKNVQYYAFMPTYNASNEKVSVAYNSFLNGVSVRCVKNK